MHAAKVSESGRLGDFMSGRLPSIGDSVHRRPVQPTERQRQQQFQRVTGRANMVRWTMPSPNRERFRYRAPTNDRVMATPRMSPASSVPDQYIEWQKAKTGRGKGNPFNYRWSPAQKSSTLSVRLGTLESSTHTPRRGAASDGDTREPPLVRLGTYELIGPTPTMVYPQVTQPTPKPPGVTVQNFEMPQLCRADVAESRLAGVEPSSQQPTRGVYRTEQETLRQQKASVVTLSLQQKGDNGRGQAARREPIRQLSTDDPESCVSDPVAPSRWKISSLTRNQSKEPPGRTVRLSGSDRPCLGRFNKLDVFSERSCRINLSSPVPSPRVGGDTTRRPLAPPPTFRTVESVSGSQQPQYGAMVGRKLPRKTSTMLVGRVDVNDGANWTAFAGNRGSDRSSVVGDLVAGNAATLCGQRYGQTAPFGATATETPRVRRERKQALLRPLDASPISADETADMCRWARAAIAAHDNDDDLDDDGIIPSPVYGAMTSSHDSGEE